MNDAGKPGKAEDFYKEAVQALAQSKLLLDKTLAGPPPAKYSSLVSTRRRPRAWNGQRTGLYYGYIRRYADLMFSLRH